MNRLRETYCYLAGAMDRVSDGGVGWRQRIKRELADLEIQWFDPTCKPTDIAIEDEGTRHLLHEAKLQGNFAPVVKTMKLIRQTDLRMIDLSSFIIANLDLDVHACGTYEEIFLSNRQKKPVLIHVEQGKQNAPNWLFGAIPYQHIFDGWNDLASYVRSIAADPIIDRMNRWHFFDFEKTA